MSYTDQLHRIRALAAELERLHGGRQNCFFLTVGITIYGSGDLYFGAQQKGRIEFEEKGDSYHKCLAGLEQKLADILAVTRRRIDEGKKDDKL